MHAPVSTYLKSSPHPFAQKLPHPHTNSLQLRRQKYGSSKEVEPMNYVEQAKTLVQTLVHFFQVQDKINKLDSYKSRKKNLTPPLHTGIVWLPAQQQQHGYQVCRFLSKMTLVKIRKKTRLCTI